MSEQHQDIPFAPTIPNSPINKNFGFQAQSVYVDNYTAYWLYFKDAQTFVPPWWYGAVLPLSHSTSYAYVEIKSPYGLPQAPVDPSYQVRLLWTDAPVTYDRGISLLGADTNIGPITTSVQNLDIMNGNLQILQNNLNTWFGGFPQTGSLAIDGTSPAETFGFVPFGFTRGMLFYNNGPNTIFFAEPSAGYTFAELLTDGMVLAAGNYWNIVLPGTFQDFQFRCNAAQTADLRYQFLVIPNGSLTPQVPF